jgi:hypothetical protein
MTYHRFSDDLLPENSLVELLAELVDDWAFALCRSGGY